MSENSSFLIRDQIYVTLRRELLDCTIAPGADIYEPELSERFSSSRSPVRDALLRLEAEGLVVIHPRKGYQATPISISDADDLFDFRALLEPACAQNAVATASDDALRAFDVFRSVEAFAASRPDAPPISFVGYNRAFHVAIADTCANRRLRDATLQVIEQFDRLVHVSLKQVDTTTHAALVSEHGDIIDALQARDGRRAARILCGHVSRARKRVLRELTRTAIVP
jgi:DNA-binding GntR family transcriptional regulator